MSNESVGQIVVSSGINVRKRQTGEVKSKTEFVVNVFLET